MTKENYVNEVLAESETAAVYAMGNTTSSTGAVSGAKKHFADKNGYNFDDVDGTLFTKGYGPAEHIAAVKHE
ncbi:hypothetical protein HAPG_00047 [Halorubrum phage GNf2]|nr:hypothetical protein HAPG_00047 [Halorubrum phage GNf2]